MQLSHYLIHVIKEILIYFQIRKKTLKRLSIFFIPLVIALSMYSIIYFNTNSKQITPENSYAAIKMCNNNICDIDEVCEYNGTDKIYRYCNNNINESPTGLKIEPINYCYKCIEIRKVE